MEKNAPIRTGNFKSTLTFTVNLIMSFSYSEDLDLVYSFNVIKIMSELMSYPHTMT